MTAGIRAPVTRVAPSRRGTAPRWRAHGRAARIPRAARPDDGAEEKDGDGRDAWVGRDGRDASTSSAAAATVAAVASASLLFAIPAIPAQQLALAMATEQPATMEAPSTTTATGMSAARDDRDRRTASRMVDMFETLSREDKVRVVEKLMFETESAARDRAGPAGDPRGPDETDATRPEGTPIDEGTIETIEKPSSGSSASSETDAEARYVSAAERRRALLEPLASDALAEMDERDGWPSTSAERPESDPASSDSIKSFQSEETKEALEVDGDEGVGAFVGGALTAALARTALVLSETAPDVFQKVFQWFRDAPELLEDPDARFRAGSYVLVATLVAGTLVDVNQSTKTDGEGGDASDDGEVVGSNPVKGEKGDAGEGDGGVEMEASAVEKAGPLDEVRQKTKSFQPARPDADGVLWSRSDDSDLDGGGTGSSSTPGVLWTRAEGDGVNTNRRRRRRGGGDATNRRRAAALLEVDQSPDDLTDVPPEAGPAPTRPSPPTIGPVEDENMEGFRLSGRGRGQR